MEQEDAYMAALEAAESFQILGDQLEIAYDDGMGVLNYAADRTPLEGTYWALISYGSVEQPQELIEGTEITALFERAVDAPSGVMAGTTGCNDYEATYTASLDEIKVNLPTTTQQFCGDAIVEQEQAYFLGLNAASQYRILGNALQIPYDEGRQMLNFVAVQPPVSPPTAVIKAPVEAQVGELVFFDGSDSQSTNPIEVYKWDFGDGTFANAATVARAYSKAGVYNVTLTVIDSAGLSDSAVHAIKINEVPETPPTAVIEGPATAKVDEEVTFNGGNSKPGSSPIVAYSWNFGNGQTVENSRDPSATTVYDRPGVYQVILTVTDQNGLSDSASLQILVFETPTEPDPPTAVIRGPAEAEVGERVAFSGADSVPGSEPIVLYAWDFGNGQTSDSPNPVATTVYNEAGAYNVTLTVVDRLGWSDTTQTEIAVESIVEPTPTPEPEVELPTAAIEAPQQATVGEPVIFDGSASQPGNGGPIVSYEWRFGDGETDSGPVVEHTYTNPGGFEAVLIVTDQSGQGNNELQGILITEPEGPTPEPTEEPVPPEPEPTPPPEPEPTEEPGGGGLEGVTWVLNESLPATQITVLFQDGQASGSSGCNNYSGVYQIDGNAMSITINVLTQQACEDGVMAQEIQYLQTLESSNSYQVQGNQLVLSGAQMLNYTALTL
jgi:PKD repeat protein